jgi:hypothetical protein
MYRQSCEGPLRVLVPLEVVECVVVPLSIARELPSPSPSPSQTCIRMRRGALAACARGEAAERSGGETGTSHHIISYFLYPSPQICGADSDCNASVAPKNPTATPEKLVRPKSKVPSLGGELATGARPAAQAASRGTRCALVTGQPCSCCLRPACSRLGARED